MSLSSTDSSRPARPRGLSRLVLLLAAAAAIPAAWQVRQRALAARAARDSAAAAASTSAARGRLSSEIATLEARVAASPDDVGARKALLILYQQTGNVRRATVHLAAIVKLRPDDESAALALANAQLAIRSYSEAEASYRACTARWPRSPRGWQGLSAALFQETRYREAGVAARAALRLEPENPNSRFLLGASLEEDVIQYPEPALFADELGLARLQLEKVVPVWRQVGDVYYRLGRVALAQKDAAGAVKNLEQACRLLPRRPDAALYLARSYTASRDSASARRVLEAALVRMPQSGDLCDALGQVIQASGEAGADQRSLELFRRAVKLEPRSARFQERLGNACLRANDLNGGRRAFEEAARLSPNRAYPFQQLSAIYTRMGDAQRATLAAREAEHLDFNAQQFKTLEAVSKRHPENLPLRLALADRYLYLGVDGPARDEYRAILQADPGNGRALNGLAALQRKHAAQYRAPVQASPEHSAGR